MAEAIKIDPPWLRQWYTAGLTIRDLAAMFVCSPRAIHCAMERYDIPRRKQWAHNLLGGVLLEPEEKEATLHGARVALQKIREEQEREIAEDEERQKQGKRKRRRRKRASQGARKRKEHPEERPEGTQDAGEVPIKVRKELTREAFRALMMPREEPVPIKRKRFGAALRKAADAGKRR